MLTLHIHKINRYAKQKWVHVQTQTQIEQYLFMQNQNRHGLHLLLNDVHCQKKCSQKKRDNDLL